MDPEKLLLELSQGGRLGADELDEIIRLLNAAQSQEAGREVSVDDVYSCLLILGRARLFEHRRLVEGFLRARDSLTVALVLEILCLEWGLTAEYLEQVVHFALGVSWDKEGDVRQAALKILGEYLHQCFAKRPVRGHKELVVSDWQGRVLELLFNVFSDEEEEQWTRQVAYYALARAAGKKWEELPGECVVLDFGPTSTDLDRDMLKRLQSLQEAQSSVGGSGGSA